MNGGIPPGGAPYVGALFGGVPLGGALRKRNWKQKNKTKEKRTTMCVMVC